MAALLDTPSAFDSFGSATRQFGTDLSNRSVDKASAGISKQRGTTSKRAVTKKAVYVPKKPTTTTTTTIPREEESPTRTSGIRLERSASGPLFYNSFDSKATSPFTVSPFTSPLPALLSNPAAPRFQYSRKMLLDLASSASVAPGAISVVAPEIVCSPAITSAPSTCPKRIAAGKPARPEKEKETDDHRLKQRQKQVDYGKNTIGYARFAEMVPRKKRTLEDPRTPDVSQKCSKRSWDGQVRKWRRLLHRWDPEGVISGPSDSSRSSDGSSTEDEGSEEMPPEATALMTEIANLVVQQN